MSTSPAETPVTTPVEELTEAMAVFSLLHMPPLTVFASVLVAASHTVGVPVIAVGCAVTLKVFVAALPHPVLYVMVTVPGVTAVIRPVVEPTDAIDELLLLHVPKSVVLAHVVVVPAHILSVPDMEAGVVATVTVLTASHELDVA